MHERKLLADIGMQPGAENVACGGCVECAGQRNDDCIEVNRGQIVFDSAEGGRKVEELA